jgi:hypothetical protein
MRCLVAMLCLCTALIAAPDHPPAQQNYLRIFLSCKEGARLESEKDYFGALVDFQDALDNLQFLRQSHSDFEKILVERKIRDCEEEVAKLEPLAFHQVWGKPHTTLTSGPPLSMLYDDGVRLEKAHDDENALTQFEKYRTHLEIIHRHYPDWERSVIEPRIQECSDRIKRLEKRIAIPRPNGGTLQ